MSEWVKPVWRVDLSRLSSACLAGGEGVARGGYGTVAGSCAQRARSSSAPHESSNG